MVATATRNITPNEYAKKCGVSAEKIIAFIRSGELKALNLAHRGSKKPRYSIPVEAIAAFEQGRQVVPPLPRSAAVGPRRQSMVARRNYLAE
jgi:hypothetical protein